MLVRSSDIWPSLRDLLGIEPGRSVRKLTLTVDRREPVLIEIEEFVKPNGDELPEITKGKYCLTKVE